MTVGWHWDEAYAWHDTGAGAAFLPAGGWIQPGLSNAESALSKTRFRDLVSRSGLMDRLVQLPGRRRPTRSSSASTRRPTSSGCAR